MSQCDCNFDLLQLFQPHCKYCINIITNTQGQKVTFSVFVSWFWLIAHLSFLCFLNIASDFLLFAQSNSPKNFWNEKSKRIEICKMKWNEICNGSAITTFIFLHGFPGGTFIQEGKLIPNFKVGAVFVVLTFLFSSSFFYRPCNSLLPEVCKIIRFQTQLINLIVFWAPIH